ncbi:MAG: MotE family protein [Hyphomicrobium sp.]|nr:MotE family protein [Hyphomicrobium sp.]MBN9266676.1 MotE family protein [Hyphomicrobium sp.]MBN9278186.1 MotE family protein [Hyphomicrobium sp.]
MEAGQKRRLERAAAAAIALLLAFGVLPDGAMAQAPAAKEAARPVPKAGPRSAQSAPRMVPILPEPPKRTVPREPDRSLSVAEQYCRAVLDPAREARYAYQTAELQALSRALDDRMVKIEARIAELKEWVARREDFANRTSDQLVTIYSGMRPEAASEQLAKIEESTAAAILSKLAPRVASQILNDMPPDRAARLAMILMGASRKTDPGGGS